MVVSDAQITELAEALYKANEPKPPTQPQPFDYSLTEAIARAKAGSVSDARMLLALAVPMLRHPAPSPGVVMVNAELAAYLAEALDKITRGTDAKRALYLVRNKGRSAQTNEQRDAWIAYLAAWFKHWGNKKHLEATAVLLDKAKFPPPKAGEAWTSDAVRKAIQAHSKRGNK